MKMEQLIAFYGIFGSCVFGSPQKNFFSAVPRRGSFGRILTMQLEPPKLLLVMGSCCLFLILKMFWWYKTNQVQPKPE